jgi:hypothetical protein
VHSVPSLIMVVTLLISWVRGRIGGVLYFVLSGFWFLWLGPSLLTVVVTIYLIFTGVLFVISDKKVEGKVK